MGKCAYCLQTCQYLISHDALLDRDKPEARLRAQMRHRLHAGMLLKHSPTSYRQLPLNRMHMHVRITIHSEHEAMFNKATYIRSQAYDKSKCSS